MSGTRVILAPLSSYTVTMGTDFTFPCVLSDLSDPLILGPVPDPDQIFTGGATFLDITGIAAFFQCSAGPPDTAVFVGIGVIGERFSTIIICGLTSPETSKILLSSGQF